MDVVRALGICKECKRVHFFVSQRSAEKEINKFNKHFNTLSVENREKYFNNKPANITHYITCKGCGTSHKNFRNYNISDPFPNGSTINPIIRPRENILLEPNKKYTMPNSSIVVKVLAIRHYGPELIKAKCEIYTKSGLLQERKTYKIRREIIELWEMV